MENDIEQEQHIWNDDFVNEMIRRKDDYIKGKAKGYSWEDVQQRAEKKSVN